MKLVLFLFLSIVYSQDIKRKIQDSNLKKDPVATWPAHGFNVTFGKETGYVNLMVNLLVDRDNNRAKVTAVNDFLGKEREMFSAIIQPGY